MAEQLVLDLRHLLEHLVLDSTKLGFTNGIVVPEVSQVSESNDDEKHNSDEAQSGSGNSGDGDDPDVFSLIPLFLVLYDFGEGDHSLSSRA